MTDTQAWNEGDCESAIAATVAHGGNFFGMDLLCPVCKTKSLNYTRFTEDDLIVACNECDCGIKTGIASELMKMFMQEESNRKDG